MTRTGCPTTGLRDAEVYRAAGILVLAVAAGQITAITRFGEPHLLAGFGLPRTRPGDGAATNWPPLR